MENTIELYVWTKGEVIAHFAGPPAAEVMRLFGTADLPLPYIFDSCLDAAGWAEREGTVLARVQALNPGVNVRWRLRPRGVETKHAVCGPASARGPFYRVSAHFRAGSKAGMWCAALTGRKSCGPWPAITRTCVVLNLTGIAP